MNESLWLIYQRLIDDVSTEHYRYLYPDFNLDNRLTGLIGSRGVGKTTLLLQYIKNHLYDKKSVFYFSADHIFFNSTSIYAFVENLYLTEGITTFFIDEIHRYKNWDQELKNLYDGFPQIKIVFSGSSSLDLTKGSYDLSRRAKLYYLSGLSFREYLNFETNAKLQPISFSDLLSRPQSLDRTVSTLPKIKGHFQKYLKQGFYPFYREDLLSYHEKILQIIEKTIHEDIANFYNLKTVNLLHFKKILNYLASIVPGETNIHNIGKNLSIDDKTVTNYLMNLAEAGLICLIYSEGSGNAILRRPEKIFLDNTNLQYAIEGHLNRPIEIGTIRELYFIQATKNAGLEVFHTKKGDYQIGKYIFEIGGKNKTRSQIIHEKFSYLVKDDMLISKKNEIPLIFFGFLY